MRPSNRWYAQLFWLAVLGIGVAEAITLGSQDAMRSIALQTDQKIVTAGFSITSAGINQFLIARYTTGGVLDPSFNRMVVVTTTIGTNAQANRYGH